MIDYLTDIMWIANNGTPEQIKVLREILKNMMDYESKQGNNEKRHENSVPEAGRKD